MNATTLQALPAIVAIPTVHQASSTRLTLLGVKLDEQQGAFLSVPKNIFSQQKDNSGPERRMVRAIHPSDAVRLPFEECLIIQPADTWKRNNRRQNLKKQK